MHTDNAGLFQAHTTYSWEMLMVVAMSHLRHACMLVMIVVTSAATIASTFFSTKENKSHNAYNDSHIYPK